MADPRHIHQRLGRQSAINLTSQ